MKNKILLIAGIVAVLLTGGLALWFFMKPKKEEEEQEEKEDKSTVQQEVKGRVDGTAIFSEEDIKKSALGTGEGPPNALKPDPVPLNSPAGKEVVLRRVKELQSKPYDMALIRARYDIGSSLTDTRNFTSKAIKAIRKMMGQLDGVDATNHQTYPIYGSYELSGGALKEELEDIKKIYWRNFNLTKWRKFNSEPWLSSLSLNLLFGNRHAHMWSADKIWWYKVPREDLDFYKDLNGHHVEDRWLTEKTIPKKGAAYAASGMYELVEKWLIEIKKLDEVTEQEAIKAVIEEGLIATGTKGGATKT